MLEWPEYIGMSGDPHEVAGELIWEQIKQRGEAEEFIKDYRDWAVNYPDYLSGEVEEQTGARISWEDAEQITNRVFESIMRGIREFSVSVPAEFSVKAGRLEKTTKGIAKIKFRLYFRLEDTGELLLLVEPTLKGIDFTASQGVSAE